MRFTGKNLELLFDALQDAIANVDSEVGQVDNVHSPESKETLENYAAIKADYVVMLNRIHARRNP